MSVTDQPAPTDAPAAVRGAVRPARSEAAPAGSEPNERALLAACLVSTEACSEACEALSAQDFSAPGWAACFDVVKELWTSAMQVDAPSVIEQMRAAGTLTAVGGEQAVLGLLIHADSVASVRAPIRIILDYATRRRLRALAATLGSMAADPAHPVGDLIQYMAQQVKEVELPSHGGEAVSVQSVVEGPDSPYEWVIPGLIERQDRTIVVAPEGYGKALAVNTPVKIPEGWTTMGALRVGDQVFGLDGKPTAVQAATEVMLDRPCYRVMFSDGSALVADAKHLWAIQDQAPEQHRPSPSLLLSTHTVFDTATLALQLQLNPASQLQVPACPPLQLPARYVAGIQAVPSVPVRCVQIANPDGIFLVGPSCIPTHNSTLLRQVAVMAAAGLHPFTPSRAIPPIVSLIIDAENRERTVRRAMSRLVDQATYQSGSSVWAEERCHLWMAPGGLDLHNRADQARLVATVRQVKPDLICLGPLYKLTSGDPSDEESAKELSEILDHIAVRYNCSLLIEAHAPHAQGGRERQIRPYGASLWQRWCEFGLGMYPQADGAWEVKHWRGQREEREWPTILARGEYWPWIEVRDGRPVEEIV